MKIKFFAALATALLLASLTACTGGIGGTGAPAGSGAHTAADGGIGGTGVRAEADVTLFGVVTGFGSVWVNGVEVHYDRSTPIELNGAATLALGQTVLVQASRFDGAEARASSIRIAEAVVGPVTAVDAANGTVQVEGRRVRIDAATVLGPGATAAPKPGETLRVSGLAAADGTIAATRIERAQAGARSSRAQLEPGELRAPRFVVQGYVAGIAGRELRVGAVTFSADATVSRSLTRDQLVRVSGRNEGGRLVVERAERLSSALPPRPERPGGGSRGGAERDDRGGSGDRPDNSGRGNADRPDRPERGGGPDRPERPDRSGSDRPDRPDRSGRH